MTCLFFGGNFKISLQGFCVTGASQIFTLMTGIVTSYKCDYVTVFDQTLKMILIRLDAKPNHQVSSALDFVIQLLGRIDFSSLPDAAVRNIKFQLNQLLPSLISLPVDFQKSSSRAGGGKPLDPEMFSSLLKCLTLLETIAQMELEGWSESVAVTVKSNKLMLAYKGCCEALTEQEDRARLTVEFLSLSALLAEVDETWSRLEAELLGDPANVGLLTSQLRLENTDGFTMKKTLRLLSKVSCPQLFEEASPAEVITSGAEDHELPGETLAKIDNMLEDVQTALDKMQLDEVLVEVLDLADKRRGKNRFCFHRSFSNFYSSSRYMEYRYLSLAFKVYMGSFDLPFSCVRTREETKLSPGGRTGSSGRKTGGPELGPGGAGGGSEGAPEDEDQAGGQAHSHQGGGGGHEEPARGAHQGGGPHQGQAW